MKTKSLLFGLDPDPHWNYIEMKEKVQPKAQN
jgi:hypothetical protein